MRALDWLRLSSEEQVLYHICDLARVDYVALSPDETRLRCWAWDIVHGGAGVACGDLHELRNEIIRMVYRLHELGEDAVVPGYRQAVASARHAGVAAIEAYADALDAPIDSASEARDGAEVPCPSNGRDVYTYQVALAAWRCFHDVTGEEPKVGGREPTTRYRKFLVATFKALYLQPSTLGPARWAAEMSRGHDAAERG